MNDCIFCKIIKKEIPGSIVYENDYVCAFKDLHPVAPIHILVVPKKHIVSLEDVNEENLEYVAKIQLAFKEIAKITGVSQNGYRVICNCGKDGGQEVKHLHYHFLAGKKLGAKIIHD